MEVLRRLFSSSDFMPHGYCYLWNPCLIWLHLISDALIALAYTSIPITLVYFVRKRKDLPFHWMFVCFGMFIVACGGTHIMEIWTLWVPSYWLSGGVKAVTALASVPTAILLMRLVPQALALPAPQVFRKANEKLQEEIKRRQQNEERLRESEERHRLLIEGVKDYAIFMLDCTGRVVSWNAGAERLKGYRADEIMLRHFSCFYLLEDVKQEKPQHELRIAEAEGRYEEEGWRVRKDGSKFWANIVITAMRDSTGTLRGFSKVTRDMTLRKQSEEKIKRLNDDLTRRARELEAINQELETFTYSVSHDLRAPLRHIDGFSKVLLEDCSSQLDPEARHYLERVREATIQMGCLVDDLLNLSRVGRVSPAMRAIELNALVSDVLQDLTPETQGRNIEWQIDALPHVECDLGLMKQVFANLLSNAVKFTRRRPCAVIRVGRDVIDGQPVIFVRDNGVGFDMKYADKLFGVFQRLHLQDEFEGTGVGLALVQRIVHKHGGRIWAEAQSDQGATFYFTLGGLAQLGSGAAQLEGGPTWEQTQ